MANAIALTQLDVVNACLATLGESPVESIDTDHPFVASAMTFFDDALTRTLARGWWFNTDYVTLPSDPTSGYVYVPGDALDIETGNPYLVQRGRRLYNRGTSTYSIGTPVSIEVKRRLSFDDLVPMAQHVVSLQTQIDFQADYDADGQKFQKLALTLNQALSLLNAEHIRHQRSNVFHSPGVQVKLARIRPYAARTRLLGPV